MSDAKAGLGGRSQELSMNGSPDSSRSAAKNSKRKALKGSMIKSGYDPSLPRVWMDLPVAPKARRAGPQRRRGQEAGRADPLSKMQLVQRRIQISPRSFRKQKVKHPSKSRHSKHDLGLVLQIYM